MGESTRRRVRFERKWLRPVPVSRLAGLIFALSFLPTAVWAQCTDTRVDLRGEWGSATFTVEVADDGAERSRGLMFVEALPFSAGMLFVYEEPVQATFWMRNTLIPLDMIFVRPDGVVQHVHSNAIPHDETPISGGDGVLAVLEINGGLAERLGIGEGSEMRHPAFGAGAVWPCAPSNGG